MAAGETDAGDLQATGDPLEHKIFAPGVVWNIFLFDPQGVQLGKVRANRLRPELKSSESALKHDCSTNELIRGFRAKAWREANGSEISGAGLVFLEKGAGGGAGSADAFAARTAAEIALQTFAGGVLRSHRPHYSCCDFPARRGRMNARDWVSNVRMMNIPFNKPYLTGQELEYIRQAVELGKLSGNGVFTRRCQQLLCQRYRFRKTLLTTSCTDALEMAAILSKVGPGDEVVVPSFTFVSSALAFVRQGAQIVFADSSPDHPNMDLDLVESRVTPRTKVLVAMHYAGVACDMDRVMALAEKHHLLVVEDAAQSIDAFYRDRPLGGIGHLGCFSFHETKNIVAGEGGALVINDVERFAGRSEIIWEKGTNRAAFFRGEVDKYGWVDTGSSFLPSEITAAFLCAQLEGMDAIQTKRKLLWTRYAEELSGLEQQGKIVLPHIPAYASNNAHVFHVVCRSLEERSALMAHLKSQGISSVFHYLPLHKSPFYASLHDGRELPHADRFADCLLRLPLYGDLSLAQVEQVCASIKNFY